MQRLDLGAGVDPEVIGEAIPQILVGAQGLGGPTRGRERPHQLPDELLANGCAATISSSSAIELRCVAEHELGIDPVTDRAEPLLLQPGYGAAA